MQMRHECISLSEGCSCTSQTHMVQSRCDNGLLDNHVSNEHQTMTHVRNYLRIKQNCTPIVLVCCTGLLQPDCDRRGLSTSPCGVFQCKFGETVMCLSFMRYSRFPALECGAQLEIKLDESSIFQPHCALVFWVVLVITPPGTFSQQT